jgi:predicted PurR-regulated permease PerM
MEPTATSRTVRFELAPKTIVALLAAAAAVWILLRLVPVLLVLVAALFLVGTLNPLVEWLEAHKIKRRAGIAIVFVSLLILVVLISGITIPPLIAQATRLLEREPALREKLANLLSRSRLSAPLSESLRNFHGLSKIDGATAFAFSSRAFELVAYGVSSVFLALYLMIDRDRVRGALFAVTPRKHHIRLSRILVKLEVIVGGYIRGQVVTSSLMALFTFILLAATGVEGAVALSVFAGVADVLPYIGVFLSVGPAVGAALARGTVRTLIVLSALLVYEEFESRVLVPKIYGNALRLPSSMVVLALLAGGTLGGILGALAALPVAAAIRMLVEELRLELPGESALDDEGRLEREQRAQREYERRTEGKEATEAAAIAIEISDQVPSRRHGTAAP